MTEPMSLEQIDAEFPTLARLKRRQLELTPVHTRSITKRLMGCNAAHLAMTEQIAQWVEALAAEQIEVVLQDYDWICQLMMREELHFRREGRYRLSTFQEAIEKVYSDNEFMNHYMNGLLISQLWWSNHAEMFRFYVDDFLAAFDFPYDHLEIGPGHGLHLRQAAQMKNCRSLEGWDVSESSIQHTRKALDKVGLRAPVMLRVQNLFEALSYGKRYDSIVLSEILEHLEEPVLALGIVRNLLTDRGRVYINIPVNSPAPDHLFLVTTPEAVLEIVENCGYRIEAFRFAPQSGMTMEQARKNRSTISVGVIAVRS